MFNGIEELNEAKAAAVPVFAIIKRIPAIDSLATDGLKLRNITGNIVFENIDFSYPSRNTLQVSRTITLLRLCVCVPVCLRVHDSLTQFPSLCLSSSVSVCVSLAL